MLRLHVAPPVAGHLEWVGVDPDELGADQYGDPELRKEYFKQRWNWRVTNLTGETLFNVEIFVRQTADGPEYRSILEPEINPSSQPLVARMHVPEHEQRSWEDYGRDGVTRIPVPPRIGARVTYPDLDGVEWTRPIVLDSERVIPRNHWPRQIADSAD